METLVATLLVTVAMLGLAGLQLATLRGAGTSLDLLAALGHASSHQERLRALHDAPEDALVAFAGAGARLDCAGLRRCTPAEWAEDEASRWARPAAVRWAPAPAERDGWRFRFHVERDAGTFVRLEVEG